MTQDQGADTAVGQVMEPAGHSLPRDLSIVVEAWDRLSGAVRRGILDMVRAGRE